VIRSCRRITPTFGKIGHWLVNLKNPFTTPLWWRPIAGVLTHRRERSGGKQRLGQSGLLFLKWLIEPVGEVDKVDNSGCRRKRMHMTKATLMANQMAGLPAEEREVVDELLESLRKHRGQGPAKLAELMATAFAMTVTGFGKPARGAKLALAALRGMEARQRLIDDEGGSLSSEEAARLLGISKQAVLKRLEAGTLLAWREERLKAARFPQWQFNERGAVLAGVSEVLECLHANPRLDDWAKVLFFLQSKPSLDGERPLDFLRKGRVKEVSQAAKAYAG